MNIFRKTVDIIISDFDKVIVALENHAEEKVKEIEEIESSIQSAITEKEIAVMEQARALNISQKLKEIFKNV